MNCIQQTAQAIAAALNAGKADFVTAKASDQDFSELGLERSECHSNAAKFAEAREGDIVRGWLVRQPNLYVTHTIVKMAGVLYEVTPDIAVPYHFLAASDVPDGVWSRKKEWSLIPLLPDGDPSTLLAG